MGRTQKVMAHCDTANCTTQACEVFGTNIERGGMGMITADLTAAQHSLRTTFGFDAFRPGQAEIVEAVLAGRDVLAVMPTGSGKSLCYQLPALLSDGLTIVVSPLIALMRNQVAQLCSYGVAAASLNSANDAFENRQILDRIARSELRLVYVSPERLVKSETRELLKRANVALLAVDEAHCISQWGHDFRPEYAALGEVQADLGGVQTVAFTATADAATRTDILEKLFSREPAVFVHGFDRPNLRLAMQAKAGGRKQVIDFTREHPGQSGIIYCSSRRKTEELAEFLRQNGVKALPYHAGMEGLARSRNQDVFLQEDGVVMVATVAFGMGIDKPDVRFVLHADMPANIESYYQEIGRAGRDGLPAATLTLYGMGDIRLRRMQIDESESTNEQKRVDRQRLNALVSLCESPRCRRQTLLTYFGETTQPCGNCDFCCDGAEVIDGTIAAQKALSAMVRTGERFGTEHLTNVLDRRGQRGGGKIRPRLPADVRRRQGIRQAGMALDLPPAPWRWHHRARYHRLWHLDGHRCRPARAQGRGQNRAAQGHAQACNPQDRARGRQRRGAGRWRPGAV